MTTPPPGLLDRIKQVVGDKQIDGISAERLAGILSGWQLPTGHECALIADATGSAVPFLLHGRDDEAAPPAVPIKGINLGGLRAALAKLSDLPDTALVVLAGNPEGLSFSPAGLLHEGWYVGDASSGNVYLTDELRQHADDPGEFPPVPTDASAVQAVVLYPQG
jgi:hypothetical protein